ncbi:MAG: glutamine--fructose-6-phosphate transaminase (isomerizing) [Limnochordia bacterium]
MCGIVGYVGKETAAPILVDGLRRLEYRGYDSAGVAGFNETALHVVKNTGRLENLEKALQESPVIGSIGIAHTRWATHGAPTHANAHPHTDCAGTIAVVHNGIIENYLELRVWLTERGHTFRSETDSEVLAHLMEEFAARTHGKSLRNSNGRHKLLRNLAISTPAASASTSTGAALQTAVSPPTMTATMLLPALRQALSCVEGAYAIVVLHQADHDTLIAARKDSPLIIGLGEGENYIASDIPAIVGRTKRVIILEDGDIAIVRRDGVELQDLEGAPVERKVITVDWDPGQAEKGGYDHFMLKEIHEQPTALRAALAGRIHKDENGMLSVKLEQVLSPQKVKSFKRVVFTAAGTAFHAGLLGVQWIERWTDLPVQAEVASEFRYREPRIGTDTLAIVVSQSGETADTLAAMREAARRGAATIAITNVVGSSVAREADAVIYTQAGPEIAVASTKAYTTQLAVSALLALYMGAVRGAITHQRVNEVLQSLSRITATLEQVILEVETQMRDVAVEWGRVTDVFYIGRGLDYAVAMEGQLKLKEISYIHAEALAAGELKHGTLALITEGIPVVALATQRHLLEKTISNVKEVKARGAQVLLITTEAAQTERLGQVADSVIMLPAVDPDLTPLITVAPLQLLAYYAAVNRGCDVDRPRNLAKSVTVE